MKRAAAIVGALLTLSVLTGCGGGGGDRLTIYSGRTENLVAPLLERFHEETGVKIHVRYGDSAELALLLEQEGEDSPADVFLSQSPGAIGFVDDLLAPLPDAVGALVDDRFSDPDGRWVGLSGRVRVLVYNTDLVNESDLPESVFDLTDERFSGKVGIAPGNGSFQDFVSAMRAEEGDERTLEWLTQMKENDSPVYANNGAIVEAVASGEIEMGLVNHYYNERQKAEDPDSPSANHVFADGDLGSLVLMTGIGVLESSDRQDDANELIEFLLQEEAQRFFSEETFEYPLAAGVEPAVEDLPSLDEIASPPVDLSELGGGLAQTLELIRESGLER